MMFYVVPFLRHTSAITKASRWDEVVIYSKLAEITRGVGGTRGVLREKLKLAKNSKFRMGHAIVGAGEVTQDSEQTTVVRCGAERDDRSPLVRASNLLESRVKRLWSILVMLYYLLQPGRLALRLAMRSKFLVGSHNEPCNIVNSHKLLKTFLCQQSSPDIILWPSYFTNA